MHPNDLYNYTVHANNYIMQRSQLELESMWQKCDAWREEVEKLSPLRDEVTQLHQENARLQQELAQVSEDNTGLARQLQETNVMKMVIKVFIIIHISLYAM